MQMTASQRTNCGLNINDSAYSIDFRTSDHNLWYLYQKNIREGKVYPIENSDIIASWWEVGSRATANVQLLRVCHLWHQDASALLYQTNGFVAGKFDAFEQRFLPQIGTFGCANIRELTLSPVWEFMRYIDSEERWYGPETRQQRVIARFLQTKTLPNLQILRVGDPPSRSGFPSMSDLNSPLHRRTAILLGLQLALRNQSMLSEIIWRERAVPYRYREFPGVNAVREGEIRYIEAALYRNGKAPTERGVDSTCQVCPLLNPK